MNLVDQFLSEIKQSGITLVYADSIPNIALTFEGIKDADKEQLFSRIVCRYSAISEFQNETGLRGFYDLSVWKRVRYLAIVQYGNRCQCCGASPSEGAKLHVDHIKPKSKYPELALSVSNLQVLCADCNIGKSNKDETDWRQKA